MADRTPRAGLEGLRRKARKPRPEDDEDARSRITVRGEPREGRTGIGS